MKIELSVLSKHRSLVGIEIQRKGMVSKDMDNNSIFQNSVEITFGFLFGYISLEFGIGKGIKIEDMLSEFHNLVNDKTLNDE